MGGLADWLGDHGADVLGWGGSALLVFSLLQSRVLRLRMLNLVACVVLVVFNALVEVWPMVAMNVALCLINLWFIARLVRERHDEAAFTVVEVAPTDAYLHHVLSVHARDIARTQPDFSAHALRTREPSGRHAWLVLHGDETVGVVVLRPCGDDLGEACVELDWVTPRYRDFSPGEFVWRRSGVLREHGFHRVLTPPAMVGAYYDRIGFDRSGDRWVLELG